MQVTVRVLIVCILTVGTAKILDDSFRSAKARNADRDWKKCIAATANERLEQDFTLAIEELMLPIMSKCNRQYDAAANECISNADCEVIVKTAGLKTINVIRNNFIAEREEVRKRNQIESALKELEKIGVNRDDIKSFFRDEILGDEADDKNASAEASIEAADRERPGRFGW